MTVLGLDIGGANIKAADSEGNAICLSFPLWKQPAELASFLQSNILPPFESPSRFAVTMTGELCDCFEDKADGVRQILEAVQKVCAPGSISVYSTNGSFLSPEAAVENPMQVAASNWHALGNWSRRLVDPQASAAVLIDIGSTSCDVIPLNQDSVLAIGSTDLSRITNHELVYTGAARTPVCAVANRIRFRDTQVAIAQELFATMQDVYLILGDVSEEPGNLETADQRPLTLGNSKRRLARMLCADTHELDQELFEILPKPLAKLI